MPGLVVAAFKTEVAVTYTVHLHEWCNQGVLKDFSGVFKPLRRSKVIGQCLAEVHLDFCRLLSRADRLTVSARGDVIISGHSTGHTVLQDLRFFLEYNKRTGGNASFESLLSLRGMRTVYKACVLDETAAENSKFCRGQRS